MHNPELISVPADCSITPINLYCRFRDAGPLRSVIVGGAIVFMFDRNDLTPERYSAVWLRLNGHASQQEIAQAYGCDVATVRRWEQRYQRHHIAGLHRKKRSQQTVKMCSAMDQAVIQLVGQGLNNCEVARRIGVNEGTIRHALKRLRLKGNNHRGRPKQLSLPTMETKLEVSGNENGKQSKAVTAQPSASDVDAAPETTTAEASDQLPAFATADRDPLNRENDRLMASMGLLEDAAPLFADGVAPSAGVLLAVPLLLASGILDSFKDVYERLSPSFYGLRTTVMALMFMALIRIQRVENLKDHTPQALGRSLGLDRTPEPKTLRRKLSQLAKHGMACALMGKQAERRLERIGPEPFARLFVDGHTKEYFGKRALSKTHVVRRNCIAKGATDTWVNDANGSPVFLVTSELNDGLARELLAVADEVLALTKGKGRPTIIFDRGGWCIETFALLIDKGFHILTYRRGKAPELEPGWFRDIVAKDADGNAHTRKIHEMSVSHEYSHAEADGAKNKRQLWLRHITEQHDDGALVTTVTSDQDVEALEQIAALKGRWKQENFFKYMRTEYALDALVSYAVEPVSGERDCPNPERARLAKEIGRINAKIRSLSAALGNRAANDKAPWWRTVKVFKKDHEETVRELRELDSRKEDLQIQRLKLPERVPASEYYERMSIEKKLICDTIKMTAYQVETDLLEMVRPHFKRADDEGRKLIVAALTNTAELKVGEDELLVTLWPMSSPHRTKAIGKVCEQLNEMKACFPGTNLRLRYAITAN